MRKNSNNISIVIFKFNKNLNNWDLCNINHVSYMFYNCINLKYNFIWDLSHIYKHKKKVCFDNLFIMFLLCF